MYSRFLASDSRLTCYQLRPLSSAHRLPRLSALHEERGP
ncbi:hypothetical protein [Caudoviricetes sp.]|nr:hypothetical protein [Caudoviricetes sp.]UOF81544.1 hypothetical protein [Caudoviricetes sp.]